MSITRAVRFAVIFTVAATPLFAADGVLLVQKTTTGASERTSQIQIEKTRMRAEVEGPNGLQVMIFDGTKEVLWAINPERKTYTEMTKADVEQMAGQMNAAMAQMQAQMAQMPPAQREQMERMMAGRMGGMMAAAPKTEYRKTGTGKVGSWTCDTYEGSRNNQKVVELCTVAP